MSLSGYMPPLCDPVDGHLLLDGGYTNNLPGMYLISVPVKIKRAILLPMMRRKEVGGRRSDCFSTFAQKVNQSQC